MGLSLAVGILIDLAEYDEEGLADYTAHFDSVNSLLRRQGLPPHVETRSAPGLPWGVDMVGYSGLHYVRRLGAHLWSGKPLPPPTAGPDAKDPVLEAIYRSAGTRPPFLGLKGPAFEHLINHSDAEGFYVPVDFERVIVASEDVLPGGYLGSTQRLQAELRILARAVELPEALDPEGKEMSEARESRPATGPKWKRYGLESYGIANLLEACALSIKHRAAIVFT